MSVLSIRYCVSIYIYIYKYNVLKNVERNRIILYRTERIYVNI